MGFVAQVSGASHYESGRAEAALLGVVLPKSVRHGMQTFGRFQAFNGGDFAAFRVYRESCAGIDGAAVEMNGASAAGGAVANLLRASEIQVISQSV